MKINNISLTNIFKEKLRMKNYKRYPDNFMNIIMLNCYETINCIGTCFYLFVKIINYNKSVFSLNHVRKQLVVKEKSMYFSFIAFLKEYYEQ